MAVKQESSFHQPKRTRNAVATREAILHSAAAAFSRHGYDGIGVREIAQTAGVTAVLVNRYFGSKEELFAATVELVFTNISFLEGEFMELADRVTAAIMTKKTGTPARPYDGFLLLLRSAPNPRAAEIMRDCIAHRIEGPMKSQLQGPRAGERAAMIIALMAGFLLMRRVIGNKALSDANGALSGEIKMMFQQLIDGSTSGGQPRRQNRANKQDE
jgi:AcrR family transcriptional regulator